MDKELGHIKKHQQKTPKPHSSLKMQTVPKNLSQNPERNITYAVKNLCMT